MKLHELTGQYIWIREKSVIAGKNVNGCMN